MPAPSTHNRSAILPASLALVLCVSLLPQRAVAQGWQRVVDRAGSPASAVGGGAGNTLYAGFTSGHVFRSDDNGLAWSAVTNGLVDKSGRMLLPKAFVVTPTGRVLRGGDNASWENKIGSPVFRSDDRGAKWTEVPLPFVSPARNPAGIGISDMVVHKGALYFSDLLSEGVWRSGDDGATWTAVGAQLPSPPFIGFAKTYYALASTGDALLTVQASKGVFRSTDGGTTWAQAVEGIPGVADSPLVGGRTWSGSDVVGAPDGTAFAVSDGRLYRSRDGGASWAEVGQGILQSPNPFAPSIIQPSARKVELLGDRVFVSTSDSNPRFFEGTALGGSWTELPRIADNADNGSLLAQSFAAHNGALYFAGSKGIHRLDLATAVRTSLRPVVSTTPDAPFFANVGGTVSATARARGTAPFTYEWRLNDVPLAGQTSELLSFTATGTNQSGTLSVVVGNAAGRVTNVLGALTVGLTGPGRPDFSFRPQRSGPVTTFAFGPDGSVFYGGPFSSQPEAYTGVRHTTADGLIDPGFVTGAVVGTGSGPGLSVGTPSALFPLGDGSVLVGATDTSDGQRYYRRLLPSGAIDATWPWPAEVAGGPRKIVRLADGKFLIAGGSVGGVRRLNADGTYDPTFQGPASIGRFQANHVSDLALLPGGHILIVGSFDEVDLVRRVGIARLLPSGALDRGWVPASTSVGAAINTLAVQPDGKILIGGRFTTLSNQPRRGLARLNADGSLDPSLGDIMPNISPSPTVNAIALQPDGKFWVGGSFFAFAGRNYLVRLNADGTLDTGMPDIGLDAFDRGTVNALALTADGRLWIGMPSAVIRGQTIGQLFRVFTDITGPSLGYAGLDQTPDAGASITLRGTVTGPSTGLQWRFNGTPIAGATALTLPLGNVTSADSGNYDLVVTSTGGTHTSAPANVRVRGPVVIDRQPSPVVGVVSNSVTFSVSAFGKLPLAYQWFRDGTALANGTNPTLTLTNLQFSFAADYSVKVTGGDNTTATSETAFLAVIPQPGTADPAFRPSLFRPPNGGSAFLNALAVSPDGRALVGGTFATATNGPLAMLARLMPDGSVDPAFRFDPSGLGSFEELALQPDGRIVIRVRSSAGGGPYLVRRLGADGSPDPTFAEPGLPTASGIAVAPDGSIIVTHSTGLARLSPDGAPDAAFAARAKFDSAPVSISIDPAGRIYAGGFFNTVGGQPRRQLARLKPDGSLDTTFAPTNSFSGSVAITAFADGLLVSDLNASYRFDDAGRISPTYAWAGRLAAWDLSADGGLVGVLPTTFGEGVILDADGTDASPVGRMKVPASFGGYRQLRIGADGALWLLLGSNSGFTEPSTLLFKLNGSLTPLALVTHPASQTVDAGAKVALSATATGTSRIAYQWQRDGADLVGETNATFVLGNAQPAASGDYTVVVRNRSGSRTSRVATLVVLAAPEILVPPAAVELGSGDTLRLAVTARGIAPLTYQWRRNGVPLPGATFASYTNRAVAPGDSGAYDVVVGNARGSATSAPATVSVVVRPGAVIGSFPTNAGTTLAVTELNVLPNGLYLSGGSAYNRFGELQFSLPYPYNGAPGTSLLRDRVAVDAANGRIYMSPTYAVRAFGLDGKLIPGYAPAFTGTLRVEADGAVLLWANAKPVRIEPDGTAAAGFAPAAGGIGVQPLPDGKILVLSETQRVLQGSFVFDTTVKRLDSDGSLDPAFRASTNVFALGRRAGRLAVDRQGRFFVLGGFDSYNGQPRSRLARFLADGTLDPTFQPAVINGEVMEIAEQVNGKLVIVGAFTQVGGLPRSLIARLNPDGSHDPGFAPGAGLTNGGGQNIAYDVALLPGGEILVAGTFTQADGRPRNGLALFTGDTPDLYLARQPVAMELLLGGTGELVAEAVGSSAVTYQWTKDGKVIPGETRPVLRLAAASAATIGDYRVVARNASGELASLIARVEVVLPPVIDSPPGSVVVDAGKDAAFSVAASGRRLAYQWRRAGTNLPAATNSSLVVSNVTSAARYSVVVSNPSGSVTSAEALLRLRPAVATGGEISTDKLLGRHSFEGTLNEDSARYGGGAVGAPTFVAGHEGSAVRITTGKDFVQTALTPLALQPYTTTFWIRPETKSSLNVFNFTVRNTSFGDVDHYLYLGGDDTTVGGNRVFLGVRGVNTVVSTDNRAYVPNLVGRWTHVALVYRGGVPTATAFSVYIDGEALALGNATKALVTTPNSITSFGRHGGGLLGANSVFLLDDVRLYNRPLEAAEVLRLARPVVAAPLPQINRQPVGGNADPGGSFTFSVDATGTDLFYEWYRGTNLLAAADGPALTLSGLTAADAGDYRVVVSNSGGSTNSLVAALTVSVATDPFAVWAATAGLTGAAADPAADPDLDGAVNLAEFAYGTSPSKAGATPVFAVSEAIVGGTAYPTVTWTRRKDLGPARIELKVSSSADLADELGSTTLSVTPLAGGLEQVVTRSDAAQAAKTAQFFRFTVRR